MSRRPEATLRMPAEWERHEATWIAWPHNSSDWPGKFGAIPWAFAEMVFSTAQGTFRVRRSPAHHSSARAPDRTPA